MRAKPISATEQLLLKRAPLARTVLRAETRRDMYDALCQQCVGIADIHMAWVGEADQDRLRAVAWAGAGARDFAREAQAALDAASPAVADHVAEVWSAGRPIVCDDCESASSTLPHRPPERFAVRSFAAFPLCCDGTVVAVLSLCATRKEAFDDPLQQVLGELADDVAQGLEHLRRFEERVRLKQEVDANEQQMRQAFDLLPAFVAITSRAGHFIEVNSHACSFFGLPREQLLGRTPITLGVGIAEIDHHDLLARLEATGTVRNFETQLTGARGRVVDVVANIARIQYHGEPANLYVSVDVTERNRAFELLAQSQRQLYDLVESANDAIISVDSSGKMVVFNRAASIMFGVSREAAIGQPVDQFIPVHARSNHVHRVRSVLEGDPATTRLMDVRRPVTALRADGTEFPVQANLSIVGEGAERRVTVIVRDVSVLHQAEQARLAALEASAVATAKAAFFSRMSHELRTPLTAVLGYSRLLADNAQSRLGAVDREHLLRVLQAGSQLRSLVDDVLHLSQVQAGGIKVERESVNVATLLDTVYHMNLLEATQRGVTLRVELPSDPSIRLHTDPLRLRQVLLNLVSNALKYNRRGGWATLKASILAHSLRLSVTDNGLGMSAAQLASLFEPFNRLGRERSAVEGTGLGLTLVRELVELLGGSIDIRSREGEGTQVDVALPLPPQASFEPTGAAELDTQQDEGAADVRGTVLYIEDSEVNRILVSELMRRVPGARLELASTGEEGLRIARAAPPDLILLDIHLPDIHGCEVLRQLRENAALRDVPVIALSANAMPEDIKAALAAGAKDYWTKPIDFEQFVAGVRRHLRQATATD